MAIDETLAWLYLAGKGGGGEDTRFELVTCDYLKFPGDQAFRFPGFTVNADHKITVDFEALEQISNQTVFGTEGAEDSSKLPYVSQGTSSGKWKTINGSAGVTFSAAATGRHTFVLNYDGNSNYMDGTKVCDYSPITNSSARIILGWRESSIAFNGRLFSFVIESLSTGEELLHAVPVAVRFSGTYASAGLYDTVNENLYLNTGCAAGNLP